MSRKSLIISHGADADGFASAALLADSLDRDGHRWELRFADYDDVEQALRAAARGDWARVLIADLALRRNTVADAVLETVMAAREVGYFDHHELEPERLDWLSRVARPFVHASTRRCTAQLIVQHLGITSSEHRMLAAAAQGSDYDGTVAAPAAALGTALDRVIQGGSGLSPHQLVAALVAGLRDPARPWRQGPTLAGSLAAAQRRVSEQLQAPIAALRAGVSLHRIRRGGAPDAVVACTCAAAALPNKEALRLLREQAPQADIHIVFFDSRAVFAGLSPAGSAAALPLLALLAAHDGGGRDAMGGFRYDTPTTAENYRARRDALLAELEQYCA